MLERYAFMIAVVATAYAVVLVQPGMLLGGLYQRLQDWTDRRFGKYPEEVWWLKPLVSCSICVAGQWCFWGYILLFWQSYNTGQHLYFTALGMLLAAILRKIYIWSKN